jgi:hypothetical protein
MACDGRTAPAVRNTTSSAPNRSRISPATRSASASDRASGRFEQLVLLDKALSADGHDVVAIAREGSQVAGELVAVGGASGCEEQVRVTLELAAGSAFDAIQVHRREFFGLGGAAAVKRDLPGG